MKILSSPLSLLSLCACAVLIFPASAAHAQNEVINPGFETGNFNGWTVEDPHDQYVAVHSNIPDSLANGPSHSGNYYAVLAGYFVPFDTISQSIITQAGHQYDFSFWLRNNGDTRSPGSHNTEFKASFDGTQVLDDTSKALTGWQYYSFTGLTATSGSALVSFSGANADTFWALDDVNVSEEATVTPEAGSLTLFSGPMLLGGICFLRRRLRRS